MSNLEDVFGEPISVYTTEQAVEDGFLVAVTPRDVATRSVWEWLKEKTPMDSKPPDCWPVDMMGWFRAGGISQKAAAKLIAQHGLEAQAKYEEQVRHDKALALCRGLIGSNSRQAIKAEESGQIFEIYADENATTILGIKSVPREDKHTPPYRVMYLRPNEVGGVTLMFPEDN
jgi:hypothetical protein